MVKVTSSHPEAPQKSKVQYESDFDLAINKLNIAQRDAVTHIDGPVLVIAGPGTGKTEIIAARIGVLLRSVEAQAAPYNILCLTYTDAATVAMRQRLLKMIGPDAYRVNIYTFHAFCNEVIQYHPDHFGKKEMEPISDLENIEILQQILDELPNDNPLKRFKGEIYYEVGRLLPLFRKMKEEGWTPEYITTCIDAYLKDLPNRDEYIYKRANKKQGVKVGDIKQNHVDAQAEKMDKLQAAAALFPIYLEKMFNAGRYDYNDMIQWVIKEFQNNEDLLRSYQEQYLYFLVDEYQDTNGSQNQILQLLVDYWDTPNVFTVGDDDQSIYEFQGARMKNILDYYNSYKKDIKVVVLEDNYRSSQQILDYTKALIDNNSKRLINIIPGLTKTLQAKNEEVANSTVTPAIVSYYNAEHEVADIIIQIEKLQKEGVELNEVAIIYYRHRQADEIIELLERKEIPYNVAKKVDILKLPLIRNLLNVLAYLQMEHVSPHSGEPLLFEMMHYGFFDINPRDIARISSHCATEKTHRWREVIADKKMLEGLKLENPDTIKDLEYNIFRWIKEYSNLTLPMLFEKIINWGGVLKHVLNSNDKLWLMQVLSTLFDFIKEESKKSPRISISTLLTMIDQMERNAIPLQINKTIYEEHGVNLTTAHSAKGHEFKYVYLIGCTKRIWEKKGNSYTYALPDTLTFTKEENLIEGARRLFYVAISRAKEYLQISYPKHDVNGKELEKTLFIAEIQDKIDATEDDRHLQNEQMIDYKSFAMKELMIPTIDLMDKTFIDTRLEKYSLSITHLNNYLRCPLSFYFQNILRVPVAQHEASSFGTSVHFALKELFSKMQDHPSKQFPSKKVFLQDFHLEMERNKDSFTDTQYDLRIALAEKTLPLYHDKYVKTWNKVAVTEYNMRNIEVEGIPINGKLDKLEFNGREVNVVDYKTGKVKDGRKKLSPPNDKNPLGEDYWRQIVFYQILMDNQRLKKWEMVSGEIDFIEADDEAGAPANEFVKIKIAVTREDVKNVMGQIKSAYSNIMDHNFSEGCNDKNCRWCNFVKNHYITDETSLDAVE